MRIKLRSLLKNLDAFWYSFLIRYVSFIKNNLPTPNANVFIFRNMLDSVPDQLSKLNEKRLISVGRLSREKGVRGFTRRI